MLTARIFTRHRYSGGTRTTATTASRPSSPFSHRFKTRTFDRRGVHSSESLPLPALISLLLLPKSHPLSLSLISLFAILENPPASGIVCYSRTCVTERKERRTDSQQQERSTKHFSTHHCCLSVYTATTSPCVSHGPAAHAVHITERRDKTLICPTLLLLLRLLVLSNSFTPACCLT